MTHIGEACYRWLEGCLGEIESVRHRRWPGATCDNWEVVSATGRYYLKRHPSERTFHQEVRAYREWAPRLGSRAPALVDAHDDYRALIISEAPGTVMSKRRWPREERARLHQEAGRLLHSLHEIPASTEDPLPFREALSLRLHFWSQRGESFLPEHLVSWTRSTISNHGPLFCDEEVKRVPCHLDFQERNWVIDESSTNSVLRVIDFEHARCDYWLNDLVKLETGEWSADANLRDAFLDGYGRDLKPLDERRLTVLGIVWAVATLVWGHDHDHHEFEDLAWRALDRAQKDL